MNVNYTIVEKILWNFYIADLNGTTFEHVEEVPNMVNEILPIFMAMIIVEHFVLKAMGKGGIRLGDGITSLSLGTVMTIVKMVTRGVEMVGYRWLYEHRLLDMDWQSPWTWWIAAISVDFGYYWTHRASHEINLLWSGHQVHHSSEEYNLTMGLRVSAFQRFFSFAIYLPLALLGVPLPAVMVHIQFNLFFQFWMHTELIGSSGPLGWILNNASHHRVHHGTNKWCLDKNYAGFLIIWDRMFGTFQPERKDEAIVYGLVDQPQTLEPIYLQLFYFKKVFEKAISMPTWTKVLKALFYGPGWFPGTARLGNPDDLPDKTKIRPKYTPKLSKWMEIYLVVHFLTCIVAGQQIEMHFATFSWFTALGFMSFLFLSFSTIGAFYDGYSWAPAVEAIRCLATVGVLKQWRGTDSSLTGNFDADAVLLFYFAFSFLLWCSQTIYLMDSRKRNMKHKLK